MFFETQCIYIYIYIYIYSCGQKFTDKCRFYILIRKRAVRTKKQVSNTSLILCKVSFILCHCFTPIWHRVSQLSTQFCGDIKTPCLLDTANEFIHVVWMSTADTPFQNHPEI